MQSGIQPLKSKIRDKLCWKSGIFVQKSGTWVKILCSIYNFMFQNAILCGKLLYPMQKWDKA